MVKKYFFVITLFLGILLFKIDQTWSYMGMVTGSKTGTYYQFGQDIADLGKMHGMNILVKESKGSLDNIERMQSRENAAFGIVQSDVLGILYLRKPQVAKQLVMIYPFYNEEVHILAQKHIKSLLDLNQKTIATGTKGSGNWLTTAYLLHKMHIKPAMKIMDLEPLDALIHVLEGKIDAMIYVGGKPIALFSKMEVLYTRAKYKPLIDNVHFIPLNHPEKLQEYYVPSEIGPLDYSWVKERVATIAVKALLVSFDFSGSRSPYYKKRCQQLRRLSTIIEDNLSLLKKEGHKKWKEVNLDVKLGKWKLDPCSHTMSQEDHNSSLYEELKDMFE
jgi:TRAP transporter TAXI family solute receptor